MAITATFSDGILTVIADDLPNAILISRDMAGTIFVNLGAVSIQGGPATVGNTTLIALSGLGNDDYLALDETNGALPASRVTPGAGNDVAQAGSGDDTLIWNNGDGSDTIDGQAGSDALQFNSGDADDNFALAANAGRLLLFRDVGLVTMDLDEVERIRLNPLGGADTVVIDDLGGTDATQVDLDLAGILGGTGGDGALDTVFVATGAGNDTIAVGSAGGPVVLTGLAAPITILNAEADDRLLINALGGADTIAINAGVALNRVEIDLVSDGAADRIVVNGSDGADAITVALPGGVAVNGLSGPVVILGSDPTDTLTVNGGNGDDTIDASALPAGNMLVTLEGGAGSDILIGTPGVDILAGNSENDTLFGGPGDDRLFGDDGEDTGAFGANFLSTTVSYLGNTIVVQSAEGRDELFAIERFQFGDGLIDNADGDRLVDDLFYSARNPDIWNAQADPDAHFHLFGWREGRDPNAFFSTAVYLSANPDVRAAGVDPLVHFDQFGQMEGRAPSPAFDPARYLEAYPDVAAAGVNPLTHFLAFGAAEGRQPFPLSELLAPNGFDYVFYLQNNPDVAAARVDPFAHFQTVGWREGRDPNALFDTDGYLGAYADVQAAQVNPLDHYNIFGWREGRDPSVDFDSSDYLANYPDVAAAQVNPLSHFLLFGTHEGRSPFADGTFVG